MRLVAVGLVDGEAGPIGKPLDADGEKLGKRGPLARKGGPPIVIQELPRRSDLSFH